MRIYRQSKTEGLRLLSICITFFLLGSSLASAQLPGISQLGNDNSTDEDLDAWFLRVDSLLADIELAQSKNESFFGKGISFMQEVTGRKFSRFYGMAHELYFEALRTADFENDFDDIKAEVTRLTPLLDDVVAERWQSLLNEKSPALLAEIRGFWIAKDPFLTTDVNERLIEHWLRINHSIKNFTKNDNSPYGTDDRGTIYVKLGKPTRARTEVLNLTYLNDPNSVQRWDFVVGKHINATFDYWEYRDAGDGESMFYIFGKNYQTYQYGLRKDMFEIIDLTNVRVRGFEGSSYGPQFNRQLARGISQFVVYEKMANYNEHFASIYTDIVAAYSLGLTGDRASNTTWAARSFVQNVINFDKNDNYGTEILLEKAPNEATRLVTSDEKLKNEYRIFRLIGQDGNPEFVLAAKPDKKKILELLDGEEVPDDDQPNLMVRNTLQFFNDEWQEDVRLEAPVPVTKKRLDRVAVFVIDNQYIEADHILMNKELIDLELAAMPTPRDLIPESSVVMASSGKIKLELPEPLDTDNGFVTSDIFMGRMQEFTDRKRLPFFPVFDETFEAGAQALIFFEAYNIPQGGYSVEYFFEKVRLIGRNQKVEEKPAIRLLNDRIVGRHGQFFAVELDDLEPGRYDIVFNIEPIADTSQKVETKLRIQITK